jgi:hypothetical protein
MQNAREPGKHPQRDWRLTKMAFFIILESVTTKRSPQRRWWWLLS